MGVYGPAQIKSAPPSDTSLQRISDLDFESLNTRDRMPHQSIYDVEQDSRGFIWIASYGGLSRFDGTHLHTYTHHAGIPGTLPSDNVRALVPAKDGDMWVGTDNAGVALYRAATDSFESLPKFPPELGEARVYSMISDGHDGLWAGGQFGLFHLDARTNSYEIFQRTAKNAGGSGFGFKRVFSLFLDRDGALWVGGDAGLQVRRPGTSTFEDVQGLEGEGEVGAHPFVWSFMQDHTGRMWVGCDHVGLATYDPKRHVLVGVPGLAGIDSQIGEHTVRGLLEHAPGQLWIATYGAGLMTYDTKDGYIRSYTKGSEKPYPLKNNFLRDIFKDRSGAVWLATDNGVASIDDSTSGVYQIHPSLLDAGRLSGSEVRSVGVVQGEVWVGLDQGEFGPMGQEAKVRRIRPAEGVGTLGSAREILAIQEADHNTAYAAGTGIFRIDLKSRTYRPIPDPLITMEVVSGLALDGENLWGGTYNGLYLYNVRTRQSRMYHHDPKDAASLPENDIRRILRGLDGRLWLSTRAGLDVMHSDTGRFESFRHQPKNSESLPSNSVWSMTEDLRGRLWVATTDAGIAVLTHWTKDGQPAFRTIDLKSGLPSNSVLTMTVGVDGRMWANTTGGLAVIDPATLTPRVVSAGEGLRGASQKLFGSVTTKDGTLFFRSAEGLVAVVPDRLTPRTYRAPLVMTSLQLQHEAQSKEVAAYDAAKTTIQLNPDHHGFTASFALLDYTAPQNTRYSHRLVGVDKDWVQSPDGDSTVNYSDLPAGDFTLLVSARDRSGQGPVVESAYRITSPKSWSETLPFRLLAVLIASALVYLLIRLRTRVLEGRRAQLEAEIALRTEELNDQRDQLQVANRLLNQLATRDPLTNLYNRRHFIEILETELLRSQRVPRPFSVLLMDIDHFKSVNDTHGHLVGDTVIKTIGARIASSLRATDTLARFGGEEYILLLPDTTAAQATILAQRILAGIATVPIEATGLSIHVSLSAGCAETTPNGTTPGLLERADKALYAAKHAGRNCLRVSESSTAEAQLT